MKRICLLLAAVTLMFISSAFSRSRSTPLTSEKMEGRTSRFSLKDPRVIIYQLGELKNHREPEEKTQPKGVAGSPYSKEEQDALDITDDLKKSYDENKARPDGYGMEIQREIVGLMGKVKSKRSVIFLCAKLDDSSEILETKIKIVEALGEIGDKKAKDSLTKFLAYLNANKPSDPMAGFSWGQWILKTEEALAKVGGN